ncbi:20452_t:CDS:2 [Cetraspora pellucida]|uniref:20452_t:CDS:1 n=1 Tax=Cetraspora pellucida TaxID=1433469 RepID=A0A9N9IAN0_9GLOM|nr:20452_t:CDS:2 [Cetraspora pellucida]
MSIRIIRYNRGSDTFYRPGDKNNNFELLDSSSDEDESSEGELIESDTENKIVESSESEIESVTESDMDSKDE